MKGELLPWQKQPSESREAYQAFRLYKDQGIGRSIARVVSELNKSKALIWRWSAKHDWQDRVDAWDAEQDRLVAAKHRERAVETQTAQLDEAGEFRTKAITALRTLDINDMRPADIIKMFEMAVSVERSILGEPKPLEQIAERLEQNVEEDMERVLREYGPVYDQMVREGILASPEEFEN